MQRNDVNRFLVAILGLLVALPATPALAQEGKIVGYVMNGRGEIKPVRKLEKREIPFYDLVHSFYGDILTAYRWGEAEQNDRWKLLGVKPDSPEANAILKAAFRANALFLDFPRLPLGVSDKEFLEAQYRGQQREARELQEITLTMLRELRAGNVPLSRWESYLEQKVRPTVKITIYGNKDEYNRKFDRLRKEFELAVRTEMEAPVEGIP